jgi:hypothetical protein
MAKKKSRDESNGAMTEETINLNGTAGPSSAQDIARLAYALWEQRGRVDGSADQDWLEAERQLVSVNAESPNQD